MDSRIGSVHARHIWQHIEEATHLQRAGNSGETYLKMKLECLGHTKLQGVVKNEVPGHGDAVADVSRSLFFLRSRTGSRLEIPTGFLGGDYRVGGAFKLRLRSCKACQERQREGRGGGGREKERKG